MLSVSSLSAFWWPSYMALVTMPAAKAKEETALPLLPLLQWYSWRWTFSRLTRWRIRNCPAQAYKDCLLYPVNTLLVYNACKLKHSCSFDMSVMCLRSKALSLRWFISSGPFLTGHHPRVFNTLSTVVYRGDTGRQEFTSNANSSCKHCSISHWGSAGCGCHKVWQLRHSAYHGHKTHCLLCK